MGDGGQKRVERRLAAILMADVAGYSRPMGEDEEDRRVPARREPGPLARALGKLATATKQGASGSALCRDPLCPDAHLHRRIATARRRRRLRIAIHRADTETLAAQWDEIDLKAKLWTIPADRMKADRQHVVPLSDAAIAVLDRMHEIRRPVGKFVFPGRRLGRTLGHGQIFA
jgi:integrase